jgi:hypothetical protein
MALTGACPGTVIIQASLGSLSGLRAALGGLLVMKTQEGGSHCMRSIMIELLEDYHKDCHKLEGKIVPYITLFH